MRKGSRTFVTSRALLFTVNGRSGSRKAVHWHRHDGQADSNALDLAPRGTDGLEAAPNGGLAVAIPQSACLCGVSGWQTGEARRAGLSAVPAVAG